MDISNAFLCSTFQICPFSQRLHSAIRAFSVLQLPFWDPGISGIATSACNQDHGDSSSPWTFQYTVTQEKYSSSCHFSSCWLARILWAIGRIRSRRSPTICFESYQNSLHGVGAMHRSLWDHYIRGYIHPDCWFICNFGMYFIYVVCTPIEMVLFLYTEVSLFVLTSVASVITYCDRLLDHQVWGQTWLM